MPPVDFKLYFIGARRQTQGRPLGEVIRQAAEAGVSAVQFREKDLSLRDQLRLAQEIQAITKLAGMKLFINDRIDLCLALDAEGVHLPSKGLPPQVARKMLGEKKWIAASCHSVEEARRAESGGADFAVLGPVYDTPSKRPYGAPLGIDTFRKAKRSVTIPLFAIGGINRARLKEVFDAGADGVAVISAITAAEDVQKASQELLNDIKRLRAT